MKKIIFQSFFLILLAACAQIVHPTGGPKDVTPPKVVKYMPDSATVNFNAKKISITFNEYIQLINLTDQLIISPPMKKDPDIKIKNKTLTIDLKDSLLKNTTYAISFGSAVADITEGNKMDDFRYVFSTGTYIDSLSLKGKVQNAFDHQTEKGILVMLYRDLNDSIPCKKTPDYFSKTKADGTFKINNIRNGTYKLFVLKDANSNYLYDTPEEMIGFAANPISIQHNDTAHIELFKPTDTITYVKKSFSPQYGKIEIIFNRPLENVSLIPLNEKPIIALLKPSVTKDTLDYWYTGVKSDSLLLQVSYGKKILDTVRQELIQKEDAFNPKKKNKIHLYVKTNVQNGTFFDLEQPILLSFSNPISSYAVSKIKILHGKDTIAFKMKDAEKYAQNFFISAKLEADTSYQLYFPAGTFIDIFGLKNDTLKTTFKMESQSFYGTAKLKINIPPASGDYIVQLMDDKQNILKSSIISGSSVLNYTYLHPGNYKVKLIYDVNKNGVWDTGNYFKKTAPEKIIFYGGVFTTRSDWDLDLTWDVK
ncbi:MAG: Ig-like domain-containing domain [Bacteroidia bacterium]